VINPFTHVCKQETNTLGQTFSEAGPGIQNQIDDLLAMKNRYKDWWYEALIEVNIEKCLIVLDRLDQEPCDGAIGVDRAGVAVQNEDGLWTPAGSHEGHDWETLLREYGPIELLRW